MTVRAAVPSIITLIQTASANPVLHPVLNAPLKLSVRPAILMEHTPIFTITHVSANVPHNLILFKLH